MSKNKAMKDFINISDFTSADLARLLDLAIADKKLFRAGALPKTLQNKTLAMIFEKPSLRTRVSFETAMSQLGGHAIYLTQADIGLGKREPVKDIARVLGRICDGIMARTFSHDMVVELAAHSPRPVINGLTDWSHPCQAMADLMTVQETFSSLKGRTMVFIGDGNNVARSLGFACAKLGMKFILSSPEGYELDEASSQAMLEMSPESYRLERQPMVAVKHADAIYTDTWVSMGQEQERAKRLSDLSEFQINAKLLSAAPRHAIVLHCLPAYRDHEITDEAFELHAATIMEEAENRLHFQRTLLNVLLADR